MALIKCPECGREISDKAVSCPHCGFPLSPNNEVQQKEKNVDNNEEVIAYRGSSRGIHIFIIIASIVIIASSFAFLAYGITILAITSFDGAGILGAVMTVVSSITLVTGVALLIMLLVWKKKNSQVTKHNIYYHHDTEEFVFYDINGQIYRVKKETPFTLRDNVRNCGELLLKYLNKKINLGFTCTPIDQINIAIERIRSGR